MRTYNSFTEIELEIKRLSLERKIAYEEIKHSAHSAQESLTPNNWIMPAVDAFKRFGILFLLKKIFKK
ncbi:DUF6327 family protein [Algibacter pacificus]|uniref:DUF6327 family protein n=1 Tax=Algibacter pacificus TaxID=2599389 RepID=UPI0011C995E0|nr:DUF6327 family protein [Algibacter pacificus]